MSSAAEPDKESPPKLASELLSGSSGMQACARSCLMHAMPCHAMLFTHMRQLWLPAKHLQAHFLPAAVVHHALAPFMFRAKSQ